MFNIFMGRRQFSVDARAWWTIWVEINLLWSRIVTLWAAWATWMSRLRLKLNNKCQSIWHLLSGNDAKKPKFLQNLCFIFLMLLNCFFLEREKLTTIKKNSVMAIVDSDCVQWKNHQAKIWLKLVLDRNFINSSHAHQAEWRAFSL